MSANDVIRQANELARIFYQLHECRVPNGYRFDQATHPQEQMMWQLAIAAYDHLLDTDLDDVLSEVDE